MRPPEETPPQVPIVAMASDQPTSAPGVGCRVLVVEDSRDVGEVLQEMLTMDGYIVEVASDGLSALSAAEALRPDVALVDLGLPGIDGFEVARRMRQRFGSSVLLVALTGYNAPEDREQSARAGFDAHLVKPVDPAGLEKLLTQASRRSSEATAAAQSAASSAPVRER
jgi:CheY-like chemotaxis protein